MEEALIPPEPAPLGFWPDLKAAHTFGQTSMPPSMALASRVYGQQLPCTHGRASPPAEITLVAVTMALSASFSLLRLPVSKGKSIRKKQHFIPVHME